MNLLKVVKFILTVSSLLVPFIAYFFVNLQGLLWNVSIFAVIILMMIRPLNDIFPKLKLIRILSLRKNLGILSATIVVSFGVLHYIDLGSAFLPTYFSLSYWTFKENLFWAHLGELTGFILLITSNKFSVRLLKRNWKRIQRLSYVYFFSGSWFVFSSLGKTYAIIAIIVVFELTLFAFFKKRIQTRKPETENPINVNEQIVTSKNTPLEQSNIN